MIFTSLWLSKQTGQMCSIEKSWALGRMSSRAGQSAPTLTAQLSGLFVNGSLEPVTSLRRFSLSINLTHPHPPLTPYYIHFPTRVWLYYLYILLLLEHYVVVSSFPCSFMEKKRQSFPEGAQHGGAIFAAFNWKHIWPSSSIMYWDKRQRSASFDY